MSLREILPFAPRHPPGGAPDPLAFGTQVCAWLDVTQSVAPLATGSYSALAITDTHGDWFWVEADPILSAVL